MGFQADALVALLQGSPFATPALSLLVLCGAVCPVPGLFSSSLVAAGFTLGFWRGLAAVYPAAVLGAVLSFAAGRRLGARWRAYIPTKVATLCEAIGDGGFFMLLLLRLTPLTVCASSAFLGSVPTISARAHAAATAVGFSRLALHVHIGNSLREVTTGGSEAERWVSVGGAVVAAIAVGNVARLLLQRQQAVHLRAASPPPATAHSGTCLELSCSASALPALCRANLAALESARDRIPVRVAPEALPLSGGGNLEMREKAVLQASRGWTAVRGLKAYTKQAAYPDLYVYFDAGDRTSAVNHFAMRAFTAYPQDIGGLPRDGIRGDVVVIRAEPPSVMSGGSHCATTHTPGGGGHAPMIVGLLIGIEELRDTLLFYVTNDARAVARERDMGRTLGGMPSEGSMPVDLGTFALP